MKQACRKSLQQGKGMTSLTTVVSGDRVNPQEDEIIS